MSARAAVPLGLMAAMLVAVLGVELRAGAGPLSQVTQARAAVARTNAGETVSPALLTDTLARPLFAPSRRPSPPAAAAAMAAPPPAALPRLAGVMVLGGVRRAILAPASGRAVMVEQGGHVGDLLVQAIGSDAVTVQGPRGTQVLHLAFLPGSAGAAAPEIPVAPAPSVGAPAAAGLLGMPPVQFGTGGLPLPGPPAAGRP